MNASFATTWIALSTAMLFASSVEASVLFKNQYTTGGNTAGLTYPGIEVAGQAINSSGVRQFNDLTASPWNVSFDQTTEGTFYVGFLMEISSSTSHYNGFELNGSPNDVDRTLTFGRLKDGNFSLRTTEGPDLVDVAGPANTDTNLVVLELNFSTTAGGDSVNAYLNPANLNGPAGNTVSASLSGFDFKNINYANVAGFSGGSTTVDEIRIGDTWSDVVAIPEPSTFALIAGCLAAAARTFRRRKQ